MARASRRYTLVMYTRMINRWWPAVLALGLAMFALAWMLYDRGFEEWRWLAMSSVAGLIVIMSLFLFAIRKSAYVQIFDDHLRLATLFLRLNISYKRIRRASPSAMYALFPPKSLSGWRREILEPLNKMTAVVIELNGYPISQTVLRFFLSPFFFKDNTPHFVILVQDWMRFSSELESKRVGGNAPVGQRPRDQSILSRLPHK